MKKAEQILVDLKSAILEIYGWPTFLETIWEPIMWRFIRSFMYLDGEKQQSLQIEQELMLRCFPPPTNPDSSIMNLLCMSRIKCPLYDYHLQRTKKNIHFHIVPWDAISLYCTSAFTIVCLFITFYVIWDCTCILHTMKQNLWFSHSQLTSHHLVVHVYSLWFPFSRMHSLVVLTRNLVSPQILGMFLLGC